jgi:hypothetical protein
MPTIGARSRVREAIVGEGYVAECTEGRRHARGGGKSSMPISSGMGGPLAAVGRKFEWCSLAPDTRRPRIAAFGSSTFGVDEPKRELRTH